MGCRNSKIIHINQDEIKMAEKFLEKVKNKEVTQGVICYRDKKGEVSFMLFNPDHLTYIIGLMERVKSFLFQRDF